MKRDDVPQDQIPLLPNYKEVQYAVNERGEYEQVLSTGWEPKAQALAHALELFSEEAEAVRARVRSGELSPLAFHMARAMMDAPLLARYAGLSRREVKRLCTPQGFAAASDAVKAKLAHALNLSVETLRGMP